MTESSHTKKVFFHLRINMSSASHIGLSCLSGAIDPPRILFKKVEMHSLIWTMKQEKHRDVDNFESTDFDLSRFHCVPEVKQSWSFGCLFWMSLGASFFRALTSLASRSGNPHHDFDVMLHTSRIRRAWRASNPISAGQILEAVVQLIGLSADTFIAVISLYK